MKPSFIKGIGPIYEKKLKKADITQAENLRHIDIAAVSHRTGISAKKLKKWKKKALDTGFLSEIVGIEPFTEKKLHQAGIHDYHTLKKVDIKKLEARTGIDRKRLENWQEEAYRLVTGLTIKARLAKEPKEPIIPIKKESLWERFKEWLKG